jgi:hypothetical protein
VPLVNVFTLCCLCEVKLPLSFCRVDLDSLGGIGLTSVVRKIFAHEAGGVLGPFLFVREVFADIQA